MSAVKSPEVRLDAVARKLEGEEGAKMPTPPESMRGIEVAPLETVLGQEILTPEHKRVAS